ncbi:MAG: RNA-binding S4 domain-containing protein [Chitinophagaceae bacterium]
MSKDNDKLRIDKYLWAIRIFKSRSLAAEACDKGRVKQNDVAVKASRVVNVGDVYQIKADTRKWVIKVIAPLHNRMQYSEAIKYYNDLTPIEEKNENTFIPTSFNTGKRLSKIGRPDKKQRRNLEDFME